MRHTRCRNSATLPSGMREWSLCGRAPAWIWYTCVGNSIANMLNSIVNMLRMPKSSLQLTRIGTTPVHHPCTRLNLDLRMAPHRCLEDVEMSTCKPDFFYYLMRQVGKEKATGIICGIRLDLRDFIN